MINGMRYKDYIAEIYYDSDDDILIGTVININDHVVFHGRSIDEIKEAFALSIDEYFEICSIVKEDKK